MLDVVVPSSLVVVQVYAHRLGVVRRELVVVFELPQLALGVVVDGVVELVVFALRRAVATSVRECEWQWFFEP